MLIKSQKWSNLIAMLEVVSVPQKLKVNHIAVLSYLHKAVFKKKLVVFCSINTKEHVGYNFHLRSLIGQIEWNRPISWTDWPKWITYYNIVRKRLCNQSAVKSVAIPRLKARKVLLGGIWKESFVVEAILIY